MSIKPRPFRPSRGERMRDFRPATVIGKDGLTGTLLDSLPPRLAGGETVRMELADGRVITLPADIVVAGSDGTYLIPIGPADIKGEGQPAGSIRQEGVIPVLSEELIVHKKPVQTGGVRVNRRVLEHEETIELPLLKENVDVRRVVIDREVDGPLPVRRDGETTIIPIVEEVLVVEKRYRLKEEIHVSRIAREELHRERVTVCRQEAEIEEFDAEGRARPVQPPDLPRTPPPGPRRRRSILGDD
jgi:uncharacterized protein (TIGR02271 family)